MQSLRTKSLLWSAAALVGLSCADLQDADPCHRFGRLVCEKAGGDDSDCREKLEEACRSDISTDGNADAYYNCNDHLSERGDCISAADLKDDCEGVSSENLTMSCGDHKSGSGGSGGKGGSSSGGSGGSTGGSGGSSGKGGAGGSSSGSAGKGGSGGTGGSAGKGGTGGSAGKGGTGGTAGKGGSGGTSGSTSGAGGDSSDGCYSLTADVSEKSNPSGTWSYGYKTAPDSTFTQFTTVCATQDVSPVSANLIRWSPSCTITTPMVAFNLGDADIHGGVVPSYPNGTYTVKGGTANLHPGTKEYAVVRWTAPETATYDFAASFVGNSGYSGSPLTTTSVEVWIGNFALIKQLLNSSSTSNSYQTSQVIDLGKGSYIDFAVGSNGAADYDSTGLDVVVCPN